jgi:hypothetical protein
LRAIRIGLNDPTYARYPRHLIVRAESDQVVYEGSPLGAVMRAILVQPVEPAIELPLRANRSRTFIVRETDPDQPWTWIGRPIVALE